MLLLCIIAIPLLLGGCAGSDADVQALHGQTPPGNPAGTPDASASPAPNALPDAPPNAAAGAGAVSTPPPAGPQATAAPAAPQAQTPDSSRANVMAQAKNAFPRRPPQPPGPASGQTAKRTPGQAAISPVKAADGATPVPPGARPMTGARITPAMPPGAAATASPPVQVATPPPAVQVAAAASPDRETPAPETPAAPGEDDSPVIIDKDRFGLNIQHLDIGMPLNRFGQNLAVVPGTDGNKGMGLNGVDSSVAHFPGMELTTFELTAKVAYNFPLREGGQVSAKLLTLNLGPTSKRQLMVRITQAQAEPPMALFSMDGPSLAPDMLCSQKPVRWMEDLPNAVSELTVTKDTGTLRVAYDGQLICTAPMDPTLGLTQISAPLVTPQTVIADMTLARLPDAASPGASPSGAHFHGDALGQPFPAENTRQENGQSRIDVSRLPTGASIGTLNQTLIVLNDEEGRYVAATSPQGTDVLFPTQEAADYSVDILIKNAFALSDRNGRTDSFFLFTVTYKNGLKEVYSVTLTRNDNLAWNSRYFIRRSGVSATGWSESTDYRPWNNALDFNEYKVIKEKTLVRFFFNGEFVRNMQTTGDAITSVKVVLRQDERLYDVIIRDLTNAGKDRRDKPAIQERRLDDVVSPPAAGEKNG